MNLKNFSRDIIAGLTVSFAALALGAAFGTMSGRGAFAGMVAAGIMPIITGIFGGSRINVSGPTAPMTAVSALVIAFAYDSFPGNKALAEQFITLVFMLLGLCLVLAGILRLGIFIKKIPQVVILGFMSGIALLIWIEEIRILLGIGGKPQLNGSFMVNLSIVVSTILLIFLIPFFLKKFNVPKSIRLFVPATLITIILLTVVTQGLNLNVQKVELGNTIHSFSDYLSLLVSYLPSKEILTSGFIIMALPLALKLTLLCYLDSLLTALVMDYLTKGKSNLNRELVGQGMANAVVAMFMGIPGAQATIRSVLLFKEGATTRLAAVITGVFSLVLLLLFVDFVSLIASAVFVGVLFKVGWDVFDKEFIKYYFRNKWYNLQERNIQLGFSGYTMIVTVFVDLNVAVISGTVLFYITKGFIDFRDVSLDFSEEEKTSRMNGKRYKVAIEKDSAWNSPSGVFKAQKATIKPE